MVLRGTWAYTDHSLGAQSRYITIRFSGIAIYVYNIIANNIAAAGNMHTLTDLSFVLDNATVGNYTARGNPLALTQYDYNVNVLSQEGLKDTEHVLEIHAAMSSSTAMVLFDYAVYTVSTTDPPPSVSPSSSPSSPSSESTGSGHRADRSVPAGVIIGSTTGGVGAGVLLTVLIGWFLRRRRAQLALRSSVQPHPDHVEKTVAPLHSPRTTMARCWKGRGRLSHSGPPAAPGVLYVTSARPASAPQPSVDAIAAAGGSSHTDFVTEEAPAVGSSLSGRAMWDDAGTDSENTHYTASDGTATRIRTDIAVLREEVSRLRRDHVLQRNSWDPELPQYQERVVDESRLE
ncbi:hypothetical protein C8Q80DRAFT_1265827 [Daedaleopsis nitida]|nr:hypothetical protein C8Q80DRAFT_1265827 [Daedaleopsis nitida]